MATVRDRYVLDIDTKGAQNALSGLKTALIAVGAAIVTKEIIDVTARFEDLQSSLKTVTGSAEAGARAFRFIKQFATQTQFGVEDLTKTFIQLKAAGIDPTEKLLRTFTDTAAVTTDQLGSLEAITALLTRTTGGGLGLEELERLADRGIPVYRILQDEIGITRDQISDFGQTAQGARIIVDNLFAGLDREFGGATEDRLNNLSTVISNFKISVTNLAAEFGTALAPAIKEITKDITQFVIANEDIVKIIGESLNRAILRTRDLIKEILEQIGLLTPGGLEDFAASITETLANFVEGFGRSIDNIVNTLMSAMDALQRVVITISGLTSDFDAFYLPAGKSRDEFIADTEAKLARLKEQFEEIPSLFGIPLFPSTPGRGNFGPNIVQEIERLERQLEGLRDGSTITFETIERDFSGASDAVSPFVESLRQSAEELRAQAEELRNTTGAVEVYDDAVLRAARAQEEANRIAEEARRLQDELTHSVKDYNAAATERQDAADISAELSQYTGLQRTLEEIRREEERLAQAAKERIREQFSNADPAVVAEQLAAIDRVKNATIQARQEAARIIEENAEREKEAQRSFAEGWKDAFEEYYKSAQDAGARAERVFQKATQGMEDAIVNFVKTGKFEFKSLVATILEELLRSQIRQLIASTFGAFGSGGGGNFFSNPFAGFFANGGMIPAGQFGVVGERGPELVTGPAQVTPITAGGNVTYNISAVDAQSFKQMIARDPGFIHAVATKGAKAIPGGR